MSLIAKWNDVTTLSGGGSGTEEATIFANPARGCVTAIIIRATGAATSLTNIWLVHTPATALGVTTPLDEFVILEGAAIPLTASTTDSSLRTRIAIPPAFNSGLGVIATTVASGVYTLEIGLEIIDLNGTGIS
jgi:hypothetical protein